MTSSNPIQHPEAEERPPFPQFFEKTSHKVGIAWLLFCTGIYAWFSASLSANIWSSDLIGHLAVMQYTISMIYGLWALFTRKDLYIKSIALSIMYVTCFAFNTQVQLFESFNTFHTVCMVAAQLCLMGLHFLPRLSYVGQAFMLFAAGLSTTYTLHLALHLFPAVPIVTAGILLFGVGIIAYVPAFAFAHFIRMLRRYPLEYSIHKRWFWFGALIPLVVVAGYLIPYAQFRAEVSQVVRKYYASDKTLSRALYLRQNANISSLREGFLMMPKGHRNPKFGISNIGDEHQPLSLYASALIGSIDITEQEKDIIFNGLYEHRHENNPRLWSGHYLKTEHIETHVDLFPEQRIAYVEQIIDVEHSSGSGWPQQQEAIYTFHLPEGAMGTSLSLWINGVEEPARLSTTSKANNAYTGIVGRERRDPAIMNWKDGNRLAVNIFPVQADLPRKFKVGFTIPVRNEKGRLHLNGLYFQGPDWSNGHEQVRVKVHQDSKLEGVALSGGMEYMDDGYGFEGDIQSPWGISWEEAPLSKEAFCFDGNCYRAEPLHMKEVSFNPKKVLLDINALWYDDLLEELLPLLSGKTAYVYNDQSELIALTPGNVEELFDTYRNRSFSVIPPDLFDKNEVDPSDFLVLTKGARDFPILSDLTSFQSSRTDSLVVHPASFFLYELAARPSLNTQILEEAGFAHTQWGAVSELQSLLSEKKFPVAYSNDRRVMVTQNKTSIVKAAIKDSTAIEATDAPDHLVRIFNYNLLMDRLKEHYFNRAMVSDEQIDLARAAYVVSPYSSLVSLESVSDYQRFEIGKPPAAKSLFNAGSLTGGSVPEPHEWALIIIAALSMSFLLYKRFF